MNKRLNILLCQIVDADPEKGIAQIPYAELLCNALSEAGNNVQLLIRKGTKKRFTLINNNTEIIEADIPNFRFFNIGIIIKYFQLLFFIKQILNEKKIDIFHLVNSHPSFLFWGCAVPSSKFAMTMHNAKFRFGEGVSIANCIIEHYQAFKAARIFTGGIQEKETAHNRFKITVPNISKKLVVSHMGAFDYFSNDNSNVTLEKNTSPPTAAFFGRIVPYKGLKYLKEAWKMVKHKIPNAKLIIIGPGNDGGLQLERMDGIEFHNRYVPDDEAARLLSQVDVFVLPYVQGSQTTVISIAHSLSKPVICSDVGSFAELLGNGGTLVPPCDAKALYNALVAYLQDRKLAERIGKKGKEYTEKNFSWNRIAQIHNNVYNEIVSINNKSFK